VIFFGENLYELWNNLGNPVNTWRGPSLIDAGMRAGTAQSIARCEYCGKKLNVQDEQGANADGNRVVLEIDGSRKRACRICADKLSTNPKGIGFQSATGGVD